MIGSYFPGVDIRLLKVLSESLNFELDIRNPSDGGKWGSANEDGVWGGLLGDIGKKVGHLGVANLFIHSLALSVSSIIIVILFDKENCK